MKSIWKYILIIGQDEQVVDMPEGAEMLSLQVQRGQLCVWALVDPARPLVERRFRTYGTGQPLLDNVGGGYVGHEVYVGTYQDLDGLLVFHVFVEPR